MKGHKMPDMKESLPNVTPLIDIVMCLIIFYMLVAKIGISDGSDASIRIPASILGQKLESMGNSITLNVVPGTGDLKDQAVVTAQVDYVSQRLHIIDPATNRKQLKEVLARLRTKGGDSFKAVIRGGADMEYRYLEQVLISCAEAKVQNVSFVTRLVTETR